MNDLFDTEMDEYDVYSDTGEYIGYVELPENASANEMPNSLEINGVEYIAQK